MSATAQVQVSKRRRIQQELDSIAHANGGVLRCEDVVKYAQKHKTSALHSQFTWDVKKAAWEHWLWEARHIIRVYVTIQTDLQYDKPVRAYVSLYEDRSEPRGGYRPLRAVLQNSQHRLALLQQAISELRTWREKYKEINELAKIFQAMDEVEKDVA